jgi:hypothetical protein
MRGRRIRRLLLGAAIVAIALVGTITASLMALLGADLTCGVGGGTALAAGPEPTGTALREIPKARLQIYREAGTALDISWPFLASIGTQECGNGACHEVNPSGCAGPMQIAYVRESACSPGSGPTIWEKYRTDGDGDGKTSIFDPADSVFTAAKILRQVEGAPPAGGSYAGYHEAACGYYGACGDAVADYADEVMERAVGYGFAGRGTVEAEPEEGPPAQPSGSACEAGLGTGASGSEIVRIAESQLGNAEHPLGSNCQKYGPCEEWCSLFVAWVWEHAGVPLEGGTAPFAYSGSIYEWARDHGDASLPGQTAPGEAPLSTAKANGSGVLPPGATPAPGDAVLYGSGLTESDHIGIVERVFPDGEITTIEGNYADRVERVGPFAPARAVAEGEPAPIFGYAQPPNASSGGRGR